MDARLGKRLGGLVDLKPAAHDGARILTADDRARAMRHANALVQEAHARTG